MGQQGAREKHSNLQEAGPWFLGENHGWLRGTNGVKVLNHPGIRRKVGGSSGCTGGEMRQSDKEVGERESRWITRCIYY